MEDARFEDAGYSDAPLRLKIEDADDLTVISTLMQDAVECPVLGEIPADRCLLEQRKPQAASSPQRLRLYRACRSGCPHSRIKGAVTPRPKARDA